MQLPTCTDTLATAMLHTDGLTVLPTNDLTISHPNNFLSTHNSLLLNS